MKGKRRGNKRERRDRRLRISPCLNCGKPLDMAEHARGKERRPRPGDWSVCLYCGHLMVFDENMVLRAPTDAEIIEIAGDRELLEAQKFTALWRKVYGR